MTIFGSWSLSRRGIGETADILCFLNGYDSASGSSYVSGPLFVSTRLVVLLRTFAGLTFEVYSNGLMAIVEELGKLVGYRASYVLYHIDFVLLK